LSDSYKSGLDFSDIVSEFASRQSDSCMETEMPDDTDDLMTLTANIVAAYVINNTVSSADLPALIGQVHTALHKTVQGEPANAPAPLVPAVSVKKSVTPDYIICLEDGKKYKSLKRHLRTAYNLSPEEYRAKWGLPADYPMVAPNYAATRSAMAKSLGLGQLRSRKAAPAEPPPPPAPVKKKRGPAKKAA
jgi:predicted transcriptional regulator